MYRDGVHVFIECGSWKTLSGFVKKTFKGRDNAVSQRASGSESLKETLDYFKESD